jgi:NADPH-dependent curcumin reductase
VVVAAASGPVGATVGQLAKLLGARAVGIAGGREKVGYLREIGFDAAVDHRSDSFAADLAKATPDGIDVCFENVGGAVWDAVLPRLNTYARVPVCGLVATYNAGSPTAGPDRVPALLTAVLRRSLTLRGFLQNEFAGPLEAEFRERATPWVRDGTLKYRECFADGLRSAPEALIGVLHGRNFGKQLVRVD